jgi:uncharacterized protein
MARECGMSKQHLYTNHLINEKSPYLLQHAHNPVNWYPWGKEAFRLAKEKDKPIFLSIGYATCHWCHVMERECFENVEIANMMNETFINIKVDREELPEVDSLYMEFAQSLMIGVAGWPLNVILTPNLHPFFAATYLPPYPNHGLSGLSDLIKRTYEIWESEERERIVEQAKQIVEAFSESLPVAGDEIPEKDLLENAVELLFKMADPIFGGIKGVPKFPIGYQWNFMIHYASLMGDSRSLFLAEKTLDMMQRGGIYDHLGGGFSRYSVDERWLVPHFEKMLYDNALLAYSYLEAWRVTQRPFYSAVTKEILDYILRDMTHPEGGFYSAEDADSEGHEGRFYTWTLDEIYAVLGKEESKHFREFYQVNLEGNFEGRNILHTPVRLEEFAASKEMDLIELEALFVLQRQLLRKARDNRVRPFKDDKVLSNWNGLMIHTMAEAGAAFNDERYTLAAIKAARFIKEKMWKKHRLLRRWREGDASFAAGLDEYAFLIKGLLTLFECGQGVEWLLWAVEMAEILKNQFKAEGGAFYQTDGQDPSILLRKCQFADGAEPSGNAIHCENLLRLHDLTFDSDYLEQAEDIFKAVKKNIEHYSPGYSYHALNLVRYYDSRHVTAVIALNEHEQHKEQLKQLFYHSYISSRSIIWRHQNDRDLFRLSPFIEQQKPLNGKTTLYLCQKGVCLKPLTDLSEMMAEVRKL